jgi:4-hydroxy-tetrahydrodipicolinate synthase
MYLAWKQNQTARAQRLAAVLAKLTAALFIETNPVPVKYALSLTKLMAPNVRLPLVALKSESEIEIADILAELHNGYSTDMVGHPLREPNGNGFHYLNDRKAKAI